MNEKPAPLSLYVFVLSFFGSIAAGLEWTNTRETATFWMAVTIFLYLMAIASGVHLSTAARRDPR